MRNLKIIATIVVIGMCEWTDSWRLERLYL